MPRLIRITIQLRTVFRIIISLQYPSYWLSLALGCLFTHSNGGRILLQKNILGNDSDILEWCNILIHSMPSDPSSFGHYRAYREWQRLSALRDCWNTWRKIRQESSSSSSIKQDPEDLDWYFACSALRAIFFSLYYTSKESESFNFCFDWINETSADEHKFYLHLKTHQWNRKQQGLRINITLYCHYSFYFCKNKNVNSLERERRKKVRLSSNCQHGLFRNRISDEKFFSSSKW